MSSRPRPTCRKTVGKPMVLSCPANVLEKRTAKEDTYDSDSPEVLSSSDEEDRWKETARSADIPAEYWNIQKLMKYIKAGNPTTTMVSLNCIMDYDLNLQINQLAILVSSYSSSNLNVVDLCSCLSILLIVIVSFQTIY